MTRTRGTPGARAPRSLRVQRIVTLRRSAYRHALVQRNAAARLASLPVAPAVKVVTLPALTVTRVS